MHAISLLVNCQYLEEAEEIIYDLTVVLLSRHCTPICIASTERLVKKINSFDPSKTGIEQESEESESEGESEDGKECVVGLYDEGQVMARCPNSEFDTWCKGIVKRAEKDIGKTKTKETYVLNVRYRPEFLQVMCKQYFPSFPI